MDWIVKVDAWLDGDVLNAEISGADGAAEFAFYVYRDGERVHTEWYGDSSSFSYEIGGQASQVRVVGFARYPDGSTINSPSRYIFQFGVAIPLEDIRLADVSGPRLIDAAGTPLHVIGKLDDRPLLFILLCGAISRGVVTPPVFHRWSWAERFPGTVLAISDPTLMLSPEVELGWYIGSDQSDAMSSLARYVERVRELLGVPGHAVVAYGSSGGGFAALQLIGRRKQGVAVAINPQTDALIFPGDAVPTLLRTAFNGMSPQEVKAKHRDRFDVVDLWRSASPSANAVIVQNKRDRHHYESHYQRIASVLGLPIEVGVPSEEGPHTAFIYDDDSGHGPEPDDLVAPIIEKAVDYAMNGGYRDFPSTVSGVADGESADSERFCRGRRTVLFEGEGLHLLDAAPVFTTSVSSGEVLIEYQLDCDESVAVNNALVSLGFKGAAPEKVEGLVKSPNEAVGWFRYLATRPGVVRETVSFSVPEGAVLTSVSIWQWNSSADIALKFLALSEV